LPRGFFDGLRRRKKLDVAPTKPDPEEDISPWKKVREYNGINRYIAYIIYVTHIAYTYMYVCIWIYIYILYPLSLIGSKEDGVGMETDWLDYY
jgi:hypothetical protein